VARAESAACRWSAASLPMAPTLTLISAVLGRMKACRRNTTTNARCACTRASARSRGAIRAPAGTPPSLAVSPIWFWFLSVSIFGVCAPKMGGLKWTNQAAAVLRLCLGSAPGEVSERRGAAARGRGRHPVAAPDTPSARTTHLLAKCAREGATPSAAWVGGGGSSFLSALATGREIAISGSHLRPLETLSRSAPLCSALWTLLSLHSGERKGRQVA